MSNAAQINEVIDKVADKIGVAADQVQPLAETVVREYALEQWTHAWFNLGACVLLVLIMYVGTHRVSRYVREHPEDNCPGTAFPTCFAICVVGGIGLFGFALAVMNSVSNAVSPTYQCLQRLVR